MEKLTIPAYSALTTFLIMTVVMLVRYFIGAYAFIAMFGKPEENSDQNVSSDISASVKSSLVFAFFATVLIRLWQKDQTLIYTDLEQYPIWYLPVSLILYLVLHDAYFYWTHRLLHKKYMSFHVTHHVSRKPSAWTSFAFHPVEAVIQAAIIPILAVSIPVHITVFGLFLILMSAFGLTNHLGHEIYPGWFEKKLNLITANHHEKHHRFISKNYGLYFTWWDHLMGTEMIKD